MRRPSLVSWLLFTFIAISLCLRIIPPFDKIFTDLGVKLAMNDAYYHMRLIDNLAHNFPHFSFYDPYFVFPGTTVIGGAHFFDWLLASVAWITGLGSPSQHIVDLVGVYAPPVMAALLVIPVYFIGKMVFNKWVGVISAGLVAILPGEFLGRSILGATDHHVAEVLFSTTAIMFLVLAIRATGTRVKWIFTGLAGLLLGVYLLTWTGGLLFIFILCAFMLAQTIINYLRGMSSFRLAGIATSVIGIATIMNISSTLPKETLLALGLSTILPVMLATLFWVARERHWPPVIVLVAIPVAGILSLVLVNWVYPPFITYLGMLLPAGSTATTTLELQPLLFPQGQFTMAVAWGNFTTVLILAPVGLVLLIISVAKSRGTDATKTLLVVWSAIMIALMLNQRRYAYYAVVNMALLAGYATYLGIQLFAPQAVKKKKRIKQVSVSGVAFTIILSLLVLVPTNLSASTQTARAATFAPSNSWQSALLWMRDNTPEPFGKDISSDYLPLLAKGLPEGQTGQETLVVKGKLYPEYLASPVPNYTVSAWWDYGYWITRTAHRVPNANPAQNVDAVSRVANLLLSTGDDYRGQVDVLKSKYVVIDNAITQSKFYAVASWSGKDISEYLGVYRVKDNNGVYKNLVLFYPAYYETLVSRLYNFDGKAVVPDRVVVITYKGNTVLEAKQFTNYQTAKEYVDGTPGTRIVSADPRVSPVPLDGMDYELVYGSAELVNGMPDVKIFEYTGK